MNICENCKHQFEEQPGLIQICPRCGQENDSEATLEDLLEESSSVEDETMEIVQEDVTEVFDEQDVNDAIDQTEIATQDIDDEEFEVAQEPDATFVSTQGEDHNDDLLVPKIPISPGQTTQDVDESSAEFTELATAMTSSDDDDTDFELSEAAKTENATDIYDPEEQQPTIELTSKTITASSLDYAEREIVGLGTNDSADQDADYVIAMHEKDSQLGSGASGIVYKAKQTSLDRTVAIKLLKKQVKAGTQSQSRKTTPKQKDIEKFLYESQITAGLDHPNVITVHDLGVTSNNTLFYSMKLFEGGKDWSKEFDQNTLIQNLDVFDDVCDAMRRAHRDRIIHRDLKPQNVLVGDFGEVQVTDWGLAIDLKLNNAQDFSGGGTPCYMAPEMSKHYLAQQELRSLRTKLDWTLENAPNNSDEIQVLKEKIAENESNEQGYGNKIDERSDVYVLGSILFQIAKGYPPHLYQISDLHRRKWGSETGKNKVRRELEMSAKGTIANYIVRDLPSPEAREALRDIAIQAMAYDPNERFKNVAELQQAVKDFRDFMRCIEDTHRGDREVESSQEDPKSYVNLNNAIYAYEGALENYPDYEPANAGLAKARFLFAERALNNQDFELGLSTMTDAVIEHQPNQELAHELRNELTSQRNRRDRRKRMLVLATMASLVAIGMGVVFGVFAAVAQNNARLATQEAQHQLTLAKTAKQEQIQSRREEIVGLEELIKTIEVGIENRAKVEVAEDKLGLATQRAELAKLQRQSSEFQAQLDKIKNDQKTQYAENQTRLAEVDLKITEIDKINAIIESEKIKEQTQFNQYISRLNSIEESIDEDSAQAKLESMFLCEDISLPVKNSWELHHLYKRATPTSVSIDNQLTGKFELIKASQNGEALVALLNQNELYHCDGNFETFTPIKMQCITDCSVLSMDVSSDGRWLVIARDLLSDDYARNEASLPVIYDLQAKRRVNIEDALMDALTFESPKPDSQGAICKEKYYCRPQHVEFLDAGEDSLRIFMVDQRAQLGTNQLRCSVLDLRLAGQWKVQNVKKAKLAGQLFLNAPGLTTNKGCLASAVETPTGTVVAAVANSLPKFGVSVISLTDADQRLSDPDFLSDPKSLEQYFKVVGANAQALDDVSSGFTPTALKLLASENEKLTLLIGNGKGELAELTYRFQPSSRWMAKTQSSRLIERETQYDANASYRLLVENPQRLNVTRKRAVFSSLGIVPPFRHQSRSESNPIHKSAVRSIIQHGERVFSASETEIFELDYRDDQLVTTKQYFGQVRNIAALTKTVIDSQSQLISVSNRNDGNNEIRIWRPDSTIHDATIELNGFRNRQKRLMKIVAGCADNEPGSEAVCIAFDDGTYEYFKPGQAKLKIGRTRDQGQLADPDALSRDDFRNGQLKYLESTNRVVMYSNSVGLLSWDLSKPGITDPKINNARGIYDGPASNSFVTFSTDASGQQIVTSHPNRSNQFVLWQLRDGQEYAANEMGPFGNRQTSRVNVIAQPFISPNGQTIAVVVRSRNSYRIELIDSAPSRNANKRLIYDANSGTKFRFLRFLDDDKIVVAEDKIESSNRVTQVLEFANQSDQWVETEFEIPQDVSNRFRQISVSDAATISGELCFVGFGIDKQTGESDQQAECNSAISNRQLIAWNGQRLLYSDNLVFSRRIKPQFDNNRLVYFAEATRSRPSMLEVVDLTEQRLTQTAESMIVGSADKKVRRWNLVSKNRAAILGDNAFYIAGIGRGAARPIHQFSLNNVANRIEMTASKVLVHHEDKTTSLLTIKEKPQAKHLSGLYDFATLSPDGQYVGLVQPNNQQAMLCRTSDFEADQAAAKSLPIAKDTIGLTWVDASTLKQLGFPAAAASNSTLVTLHRAKGQLKLRIWQTDGSELAVPKTYAQLPVVSRQGTRAKSMSIAKVTGQLLVVVWDDESNRSDIWKYAPTIKPTAEPIPKTKWRWFQVDDSNLGNVSSLHVGEVLDDSIPAKDVAPRIVVGSENNEKKSFKLYALELGANFGSKPLLELTTTDKLQHVDNIIDARFSADGKTLVSITSTEATIRMTDGWGQKKADVDFQSRIATFGLTQSGISSNLGVLESLKRELENNATDPKIQTIEAQLRKQLAASEDVIAQSRTRIQREADKVEKEEKHLLEKYRNDEFKKLETIKKDIAQKQAALIRLKKELEDSP